MAGVYHLNINQGETYKESFQWLQGGGRTPIEGEPVNLIGYVGRCQIRSNAQNPGIIATVPVDIFNPEEGRFSIGLSAAQTEMLPATGKHFADTDKYVYDVEFANQSGMVYRLLNGFVIVSPEVTRGGDY